MIGVQLGIHLFMGVNYLAFLIANIVWVDWASLEQRLRSRKRPLERAARTA